MSVRTPRRRAPMTRSSRSMRSLTSVARSPREGTAPIAPRLAVAGIAGAVVIGVLVLRLWALTVLGGAEYAERADQNQIRRLPLAAQRGGILDRNGRKIVASREQYQVVMDLQDVTGKRREAVIARLGEVLAPTEAQVPKRTAEIRTAVDKAPPGAIEPVVIERDLQDEDVKRYLAEHNTDFPGVDVKVAFARKYVQGTTAAHILGQVGQASPEDLKANKVLVSGDLVGKSGIERTYDRYIRGANGYDAVQVDASGVRTNAAGVRGLPATPGNNLRLTIDLRLQKAGDRALQRAIVNAQHSAKGKDARAGAFVAIDPKTGEVLALGSNPVYDPNIFTSSKPKDQAKVKAISTDTTRQPLINRAIAGAYPPGSTYKAITALAAMKQGWLSADTRIGCPASREIKGTTFKNHETQNRGDISLDVALETSCDTFFYYLAMKFYEAPGAPLAAFSRLFGLDAPTGLDIPGEVGGTVPDPTWKANVDNPLWSKLDHIWKPGDEVNMSIGQGDLLVTPLQMTNVYAAIANGGVLHQPHLGMRVESIGGREQVALQPKDPKDLHIPPADLAAVIDGLKLVNTGPSGTATSVFGDFGLSSAGKSGTAEKDPTHYTDLAWYCGFAPVENPEIAACAFVDRGGGGSVVAGPVVRALFDQWFGPDGGSIVKLPGVKR
ncbi:MAG: Stage sporulation protein [Thermoleophilia bacterium]|nr:Stage sporulation protein [Thermoleophilia bacterium]